MHIKYIILILTLSISCKSTKVHQDPTRTYIESIMKNQFAWSHGKSTDFQVTKVIYFFGSGYTFGIGKVGDCLAYCETSRGDTVAITDPSYNLTSLELHQIIIKNAEPKNTTNHLNESFEQSWNFVKVFSAVDSIYLAQFR